MTRVKKGVNALKSRRNILKQTKGYRFDRSKKERAASEALLHAGAYAFAHRRDKKGEARRIWNVKIGGAAKKLGTSYSKLIGGMKKKNMLINRKMLADMAKNNSESFKKIVTEASK